MIKTKQIRTFLLATFLPTAMFASTTLGNFTYTGYNVDRWGITLAEVSASSKNISGEIEIPGGISFNGNQFNIAKIAEEGFQMCTQITSVKLPPTLLEIKRRGFFGCNSMKSVSFNGSLYEPLIIGDEAFSNCTSLSSADLPELLTTIGASAFAQCETLYSLKFPSTLRKIGTNAFSGCYNIGTIKTNSVEDWLKIDFENYQANPFSASLKNRYVTLEINGDALCNLTIPSSVTEVPKYAFANYKLFHTVTLPEHVVSLGDGAFEYAEILIFIKSLNPTPPSVGDYCFHGVDKSTPIYVPDKSLEAYKSAMGWSEFTNYIGISTETADRFTVDGMVYSALDNTTCALIEGKDGSLITIPESVDFKGTTYRVTEIGESAFKDCDLTQLIVPNTVETIGAYALASPYIQDILIGTGIKDIKAGLFMGKSLKQVTILAETLPKFGLTADEMFNPWDMHNITLLFNSKSVLDQWISLVLEYETLKWCNANYRHIEVEECIELEANGGNVASTYGIDKIYECNIWRPFKYSYVSGNSSILRIENSFNGASGIFLCPVNVGTTNITVTSNTGLTASTEIIVRPRIERVWFDKESQNLNIGEEITLVPSVYPTNAYMVECTWYSTNAEVATVDNNGVVKAHQVGNTTIKFISMYDTAECEITVLQPATGISLTQYSADLKVGESLNLKAVISPEDASDKNVTWTSSDEAVVSVGTDGTVIAVASGHATIIATTSNGLTAECKVTVLNLVNSLVIEPANVSLEVGESIQLVAVVLREDADDPSVVWSSSNEDVALVSSTGRVAVIGEGKCEIYAETTDGSNLRAVCLLNATNGIETIFTDNKVSRDIYSITGQLLIKNATVEDFDKLPPGIYIIGERKVYKR